MFWVIIGIFVSVYACLTAYNRKWSNPYKLFFLCGAKGSGKTTLECKMMLKYAARGYQIYTDIEGINIPGVRIFDVHDLKNQAPPQKAALFLDEVGLSMSNRDYKSFEAGLKAFWAKQRHFRCVCWLNSQGFDVDKVVRLRSDHFYFCTKIGPVSLARTIEPKYAPNDMTSPNNDSPILQTYKWGSIFSWKVTWIPRYAGFFDSFAVPDMQPLKYVSVPGQQPRSKAEVKQLVQDRRRARREARRAARRLFGRSR